MKSKPYRNILTYAAFFSTLGIVLFSLVSVVFPALIASSVLQDVESVPFEVGLLAVPLFITNIILFGIGFLYYKKKLPSIFQNSIKLILNFEISKKITLVVGIIFLAIYIIFSVGELSLNEEEQYGDYIILKTALELWPFGETDNLYVIEQNDRFVRMFLLGISQDIFQNIKLLPFVASILLVIVTYFFTVQVTQKRFAGIVAMGILLQSYTFLKYDTIAVYENFWTVFYILSLYTVYKRWYLSSVFYVLSVFTKPFVAVFILMNVFHTYCVPITNKKKILTMISYVIAIIITIFIFSLGNTVYGELFAIDFNDFLVGFTSWANQMHFDSMLVLAILPLTVGLFIKSKQGIKEADSILILMFGSLLIGPLIALLTDFYFILPYRFVPLIVFFAIGVGIILSNKETK